MKTEITRRTLAFAALGSAAALNTAKSQEPDLNAAAKEQIRKNSEALGKLELPMSTEPAFQFKA